MPKQNPVQPGHEVRIRSIKVAIWENRTDLGHT